MAPRIVAVTIASLLVLGGAGIGAYQEHTYRRGIAEERVQASATLTERERAIASLQAELAAAEEANANLSESLRIERKKNDSVDDQLRSLRSTVGALDRLSKTDPELLTKYSKVFFLSDNYVPSRLTDLPAPYVSPMAVRTPLSFHAQALPYLESMLDGARDDGVILQVISAYRSFGTQAQLKSSYRTTFGTGANSFSADQGYSEHQLGTTVDLTDPVTGGTFAGFDRTPAFAGLTDNAYRYGFVLSYPTGNVYYQYEPWHWRFVGTELARSLHAEGKRFYDLDQRTIDTYLAGIFD